MLCHFEARLKSDVDQAALLDSEARMRAVLETAVEGIITIDAQGLIESANPAAEKIFGYPAQEIIGKNVSLLMPAPYRCRSMTAIWRTTGTPGRQKSSALAGK